MLNRAASLLIIAFWLTMTALLVRNEIAPEGSGVREVPVAHVLKLLFLPERGSSLNITSDGAPLGHLTLTPRVDPVTEMHVLGFDSRMQVRTGCELPAAHPIARRSCNWITRWSYSRSTSRSCFPTRRPLKTEVTIDPGRPSCACRAAARRRSWGRRGSSSTSTITPSTRPARATCSGQIGLDPALLTTVGAPQIAPTIRARQSSLVLHGERVDTFLLTIEQSGQTLMEIQVSQLGNVLQAKTLLGYNLAPDDIMP